MNMHNRGVAMRLIRDIDRFVGGEIELDELQSQLQAALALFERDRDSSKSP